MVSVDMIPRIEQDHLLMQIEIILHQIRSDAGSRMECFIARCSL